jgi:hypothetical protein
MAAPGFTDDVLVRIAPGGALRDVTLDGANLPAPVRPWLGVGLPRGCAVVAESRPGAPAAGQIITDVAIRNCPSGGLFLRGLRGFAVARLRGRNLQTVRTRITSAAAELYDCEDGTLTDCSIDGYGWKGFALDNCRRVTGRGCTAHGGVAGHAAHYMDGAEDCAFARSRHSGPGYGAKASNSLRPQFRGYTARGSAGAVQFQSCRDFLAEDVQASDTAGPALVVASAANKPSSGGLLRRVSAQWRTPPTDPDRIGLALAGDPVRIEGLKLESAVFLRPFFGVHGTVQSGAVLDLEIDGLSVTGAAQYALIAFVRSLRADNLTVRASAWCPAIAVYSAPDAASAGEVDLSHVDVAGGSPGHAMIDIGSEAGRSARFRAVRLTDSRSAGPAALLMARVQTGHLTLARNRILGVAAGPAARVTLEDGDAALEVSDNVAFTTAGLPASLALSRVRGPRRISGNSARIETTD